MSPLQARRGMIVEDQDGRTFEVLGMGRKPGTLCVQNVISKETYLDANADKFSPVEGLRPR